MSSLENLRRDERDLTRWDAECDVLVVGTGAAGACAAIEAAAAGDLDVATSMCSLRTRFDGGGGAAGVRCGGAECAAPSAAISEDTFQRQCEVIKELDEERSRVRLVTRHVTARRATARHVTACDGM